MPTYVGRCEDHGEEKYFLTMKDYMREGLICSTCAQPVETVIQAVKTIGPSEDHPLVIEQIGRTFTSKSQMDKYFKEHPERAIVATDDSSFIKHRDLAHEKADNLAKRMGYVDHSDRKIKSKIRRADEKRCKNEGAKIQV
jgi:hypothetical protein|tara:strand:+ start:2498 stop:2917 length:420 start_codon:yes stop_codon:yes gene_type:complete